MQFVTKTIGERKVWLKMAEQNARLAIGQHQLQHNNQQQRIDDLARLLNMDSDGLQRLECFDISHTQGEATIASCVVYDEQISSPRNTAATTSPPPKPATITPPCAKCSPAATAKWPKPKPTAKR